MPVDLEALQQDLLDEQRSLRSVLEALDPSADWDRPTPAIGWTVRHQVRHLAHGEELGRLAAADPDAFAVELARLVEDLDAVEWTTTDPAREDVGELLARWWDAAEGLRSAVAAGDPTEPVPWITGPMSRASFLTARLMETFAHGHDIRAALDLEAEATARLRHVAHLGWATIGFSFANRGHRAMENELYRIEVHHNGGPGGDATFTWGRDDAPNVVTGSLLDLCLVVTRRRHWRDTDLVATGADAERWLEIAQCFAGPPSDGPRLR